jgi:hypothetical protein
MWKLSKALELLLLLFLGEGPIKVAHLQNKIK